MRWLDKLRLHIRSLFRSRRVESELERELQEHLQRQIDENIENGMASDEARLAALRTIGNVTHLKEQCRDERGLNFLDQLHQDLRYAFATLRRNPGYAIGAIVSLGLGIGAATAVFSAVEGLILNPYPYSGADRMVVMSQAEGSSGPFRRTFLKDDEARLLKQAGSLDAVILWDESWMWAKNEGIPEMLYGAKLARNVFQVLGVPPLVGRTFAGDSSLEASPCRVCASPTSANDLTPVAVLSYRYWQSRYAGSANVIGRTMQVDGRQYTIIGVMPERFRFLNAALYIPLPSGIVPSIWMPSGTGTDRRVTLLRLRPGVSRAAASAELQAIVQQQFAPPDGGGERRDVRVSLTTLSDQEAGNLRNMLGILLGAVTLLFVIGCANVSILVVGRGIQRRYELAVRRAVGASQARILWQLLTESLVVSMAGGVVGIVVAYALLAVIIAWIPPGVIPADMAIAIDVHVLVFASVVAVLAGVAAGLSPALTLSRSRLIAGVGGRSEVGTRGSARTHRLLTLVQCAATVVLLAAAGAALRTLVALTTAPLGYDPHNVAVFACTFQGLADPQQTADYAERIKSAAAAVPGVESVALTGPDPTPPVEPRRTLIQIAGISDGGRQVVTAKVSQEYFSTIRVPVRAGRVWTDAENRGRAHVGVINDTMARQYWPNGNPIGQRVRLAFLGTDPWIEIVGVTGDVRNDGLSRPVLPEVYVPYTLRPLGAVLLLVRTSGAPLSISDALKGKIAEVNGEQPVMNGRTLEEALFESGWGRQQFAASLFSACAALALALAAVGIYSVVACAVSLRMPEFALRMALGASNARILREIFTSSMMTIALGMGGGLALVAILHRPIAAWTESSLWSPVSLSSAILTLVVVGCGAVLIPAWRAATMDDPARILGTGE
jgi:putative ABC transport system permease protein